MESSVDFRTLKWYIVHGYIFYDHFIPKLYLAKQTEMKINYDYCNETQRFIQEH